MPAGYTSRVCDGSVHLTAKCLRAIFSGPLFLHWCAKEDGHVLQEPYYVCVIHTKFSLNTPKKKMKMEEKELQDDCFQW